jgi:hypothetical protein
MSSNNHYVNYAYLMGRMGLGAFSWVFLRCTMQIWGLFDGWPVGGQPPLQTARLPESARVSRCISISVSHPSGEEIAPARFGSNYAKNLPKTAAFGM